MVHGRRRPHGGLAARRPSGCAGGLQKTQAVELGHDQVDQEREHHAQHGPQPGRHLDAARLVQDGQDLGNTGGPLPASNVTVKVTVGGNGAEQTKNIALANGQSADFTVTKPGTGAGKIEVSLGGQVVKTKDITVP